MRFCYDHDDNSNRNSFHLLSFTGAKHLHTYNPKRNHWGRRCCPHVTLVEAEAHGEIRKCVQSQAAHQGRGGASSLSLLLCSKRLTFPLSLF